MKNNQFEIFSSAALHLAKMVQSIKSEKMGQYGLKGTNARCLCEILDGGEAGLNAVELSKRCQIDKAQVSRCMKELLDKELVYHDAQDGRCYKQNYCLTEVGTAVARDISETARQLRDTAHRGLSNEDIATFNRVLRTMYDNFFESSQREES